MAHFFHFVFDDVLDFQVHRHRDDFLATLLFLLCLSWSHSSSYNGKQNKWRWQEWMGASVLQRRAMGEKVESSIGIPTERVKELLPIFSYIVFWVVRSWWPEGIHCASHAPTESFSAESAYISLTSYIIESRSCWTNDRKGERWRHVGEWERKKDREKDRDPYSRQKPVLLEVTLGLFGRHVNAPAVISCLRSHYFFFHRIFASNSVFLSLFKRKSGWNWMEYWLSWVRARLHLHIC